MKLAKKGLKLLIAALGVSMSGKYKVISTFSGIGGSSQGYKQAGFEVLASVEFLDYQAANYRLNHPNTKVYETDIRTLNPEQVLKDLNLKPRELDILDGSPPCSSFSTAGKREKGWGEIKAYGNKKQRTDDLFFEYIRFLKYIQPKVFVAENVKGLTMGTAKGYFNEIFQALKDCGYTVKAKVMNACNYSVPQSRERTIFIGVRTDLGINPSYPEKHEKIITVKEAWENLIQSDEEIKECFEFVKNWTGVMGYIKLCKQGESCSKYHHKGSFFSKTRISYDKPSPTITATGNSGTNDQFHPTEDRIISRN
jgi:DNA (cytosine-5)-methyltransferase 1